MTVITNNSQNFSEMNYAMTQAQVRVGNGPRLGQGASSLSEWLIHIMCVQVGTGAVPPA